MTMKLRLAVIEGDGIGPELVQAARLVLEEVATRHDLELVWQLLSGGAQTYRETGETLSAEALEAVRRADATLKGPVGLPEVRRPDGTEAGLLGGVLRNGLDLYANIRPIRLLPGITSRLRAEPGDIDYVIVRENTEGLYAARGKGVGNHWAMSDVLMVTRVGCERVCRRAFELARRRTGAPRDGISRVTCVDKANVLRSFWFFRDVFLEVAAEYPDVEAECMYVDAAAQALVMEPERFDVIVTENLFGDILSDLGGGTVGGVAMCPAANIGDDCAYFEPIHGSAPSIAGRGLANPLGQILAAGMLLDYVRQPQAAEELQAAVVAALAQGEIVIDHRGTAVGGPMGVAEAVVARLAGTPVEMSK
jgi:isocitrate/isopropylmalate dehydrogenase